MKKLVRWIVVLLIIAGAAVLIRQKTRPKPLELVVKAVVRGTVEKTVANTRAGTVNACRRAKLSPSLGGQIALLPIREGDSVKAGELLLEIWNEDLKAQLVLSEREVAVAEAKANAVCLSADEAGRQAHRAEILFKQRIVSEEHTDQAVTKAKSLRAECTAARASVEMRQAQVEVARVNLSRTRLIAPFDGVIAEIEGELNEYITPSPVGVLTPPAVDLIENSCYYVSAPIDEVDAAEVRVGMEVRITLDAFRNRSFSGQVRRIAPYVLDLEKQARTVEIEVSFDNREAFSELLAGYSADVEVVIDVRQNSLKIPTEAVMEEASVFVFSPGDHHVQKRTISTGLSNWAATEVVNGLAEGELIVVNVDKPGLEDGVEAVRVEERQ
ncbi:MAG: efflux RND transporter periplasmic adaptor subunit [Desulfocapsaceae bacterium]|jgi:HlyD family secretion protein|nr:efflux RND transporter periplasmic adaptor subunit [Desulfocapsaceae bacterium]